MKSTDLRGSDANVSNKRGMGRNDMDLVPAILKGGPCQILYTQRS